MLILTLFCLCYCIFEKNLPSYKKYFNLKNILLSLPLLLIDFYKYILLVLGLSILLYIKKYLNNKKINLKIKNETIFFLELFISNINSGLSREQALFKSLDKTDLVFRHQFNLFKKNIELGQSFSQALKSLHQKNCHKDIKTLGTAIYLSTLTGGSLSECLENIIIKLRKSNEIKGKLEALSAQSKMQSYVCIALPIFFCSALSFIAPEFIEPLLYTTTGQLSLASCLVMLGCGAFWIVKITHKEYML